jgi:ribose transport system ATP-binding protein
MLELRHISKSFPGVRALDDVSFEFRGGEIHGLIGENGAGKSTAIKIVTGIYQPDTGEIWFEGKRAQLRSYRDALGQGIGIVHQELQVIPDASVAENILIDKLPRRAFGAIDWPAVNRQARTLLEAVGLEIDPECLVRGLSAAQKQLIQIAKALSAEVKVLLLDEPTSSLTEHEVRRLFMLLRVLRDRGVALIFVSHKLDEMFALCDRVSVLRDGKAVGTHAITEITPAGLVQLMIGRDCNDDHLGVLAPRWDLEVLRADNLVRAGKTNDVSFVLHEGEVLGFYGLVGSGRTEVARLLIGEDQKDSGKIWIRGKEVSIRNVGEALYGHRLGYVTENRKEEGVFLDDGVRANLTVSIVQRLRNRFSRRIDALAEREVAVRSIGSLQVKTPDVEQPVKNLSGGNQQKVSIGKWLAAECDILIVDEPTVGVDVGAKAQIHRLIWDLARHQGKSVIVISSDLPELVRLVNRLLVFREQRIVGEVKEIDVQKKTYAQVSRELAPWLE